MSADPAVSRLWTADAFPSASAPSDHTDEAADGRSTRDATISRVRAMVGEEIRAFRLTQRRYKASHDRRLRFRLYVSPGNSFYVVRRPLSAQMI